MVRSSARLRIVFSHLPRGENNQNPIAVKVENPRRQSLLESGPITAIVSLADINTVMDPQPFPKQDQVDVPVLSAIKAHRLAQLSPGARDISTFENIISR